MQLFCCDVCGHLLYFESNVCIQCEHALGYLPRSMQLSALEPIPGQEGVFKALAPNAEHELVRYCDHAERGACNWLVPADGAGLCQSCSLSDVIPDLSRDDHVKAWASLERAKRRLLFTLRALDLPIEARFHLLSSTADKPVMTGHADGVITINIEEAEGSFRENQREKMGEAYRTTLGHFRHESGHYFFDRLIEDSNHLAPFRELFGDERADYQAAVDSYYAAGPPDKWEEDFISAYATMHPWEDWAETWAHYLHMVDTLDTAQSYAVSIVVPPTSRPGADRPTDEEPTEAERAEHSSPRQKRPPFEPATAFDRMVEAWIPLTLALNSMNRSMGLPDAYPFFLSPKKLEKLRFVHDVIRSQQRGQ